MANIATELNTIATATYGSDMREAIHDGLEKTNTDPAGKAFGNATMYTNDFIEVNTTDKTVALKDGSDDGVINIIIGNRVRQTTPNTVSYAEFAEKQCFIFIDATDLTLKVDDGVPSGGNDLILVGVISNYGSVKLVPGFNLIYNGHKAVNGTLPVDVAKQNAFLEPVFFTYRGCSMFVQYNDDDHSVTLHLAGSGYATVLGVMNGTNSIVIPYEEGNSLYYYLLYDVTNDKLEYSTVYYDITKPEWVGHQLIGAIYMPGSLGTDGIPQFVLTVMPGMRIYPYGQAWVDNYPTLFTSGNNAEGRGGLGIDYYRQKLIFGNVSSFNICTEIGVMPIEKNKTIDLSGTQYLYFDYIKKDLLVRATNNRPYDPNRYRLAGVLNTLRRKIDLSFGGSISRDGNSYFVFGDSIQTNVGVTNEAGEAIYGSVGFQVAAALNVEAANFAVGGMGFVRAIDGKTFYDKLVEAGSTYSSDTRVPIAASLVGGTNDYGTSQLFGDLDTPNSFVYEVDRCFKYIHDNFYQIPFLICTPLHRDDRETANSYGKTLSEYCDVIKERAQHYHLLFYDLYNDPNYDFRGEDQLMPDGLHPNYFGHRRLAPLFKSLLICG